jgi:hypothetical protein
VPSIAVEATSRVVVSKHVDLAGGISVFDDKEELTNQLNVGHDDKVAFVLVVTGW